MYTVHTLLQHKGSEVWTIAPSATVYAAVELMVAKGIGAVVVVESERLVGILTERDYLRKVVVRGKSSRELRVEEIMTSPVLCVRPERTVDECMALMTKRHIRHLPVVDASGVIGLVSIGDVVKAVIADKDIMIDAFERFILGI